MAGPVADTMTMGPTLKFVSIAHPDEIKNRHNKRKIHRHVMRDIGISRRKPPASVLLDIAPLQSPASGLSEKFVRKWELHYSHMPSVFRTSLDSTPRADLILYAEVDARGRSMRDFLVRASSPLCHTIRELCFTVALIDDSAMHLAFAESALHRLPRRERRSLEENSAALKHYNLALRYLNKKIHRGGGKICYGVPGVSIGLAGYDLGIGNLRRWATHMAGLETMIQNQGGICAIESRHLLKSLIWTEVEGCLLIDCAPRFEVPYDTFVPIQEVETTPILTRIQKALAARSSELSRLCPVIQSLSAVAEASKGLNHESLASSPYWLTLVHACYILLKIPRLDVAACSVATVSSEAVLLEVIRLAALVFLSEVVGYSHNNSDIIEERSTRLSSLLRLEVLHWAGLEELELWVSVITAVAVKGEGRAWLAVRITRSMTELGLDWERARFLLGQVAWIDAVFAEEMAKLAEM